MKGIYDIYIKTIRSVSQRASLNRPVHATGARPAHAAPAEGVGNNAVGRRQVCRPAGKCSKPLFNKIRVMYSYLKRL